MGVSTSASTAAWEAALGAGLGTPGDESGDALTARAPVAAAAVPAPSSKPASSIGTTADGTGRRILHPVSDAAGDSFNRAWTNV